VLKEMSQECSFGGEYSNEPSSKPKKSEQKEAESEAPLSNRLGPTYLAGPNVSRSNEGASEHQNRISNFLPHQNDRSSFGIGTPSAQQDPNQIEQLSIENLPF